MQALVETGETAHPLLRAFYLAQYINGQSGGAVISPWEIEPGHSLDEWSEAAVALAKVPSMKSRRKAVEQVFEKARKGNKHYNALNKRNLH